MNFPKSFTDTLGRTWEVSLTLSAELRIEDTTGKSIYDIIPKPGTPKEKIDLAPLAEFFSSPRDVWEWFYLIIKPQADALGLTRIQVGDGFGDKEIDAMMDAVKQAFFDFFRKSPLIQTLIEKVMAAGETAQKAAAKRLAVEMDKLPMEQMINDAIDKTIAASPKSVSALAASSV